MPELPDLHVFSRNLHRLLVGRPVEDVAVWRTRRRNFTNEKIAHALRRRVVNEVRREGKEVHFHFDNGRRLAAHLMLVGRFDLTSNPQSIPFPRLGLKFNDGEWLVVSDPRGWATFTLDPRPETVPDALAEECDTEYLRDRLRRCMGVPVKGFLVDQNILRGIGNAYADEILWTSRIAPQSLSERVPDEKIVDLHQAIRVVLTDAIKQIECVAPEAINGEIRDFLNVHHPDRTHCPAGHPIRYEMIAMKKSYYCEEQMAYL